MDKFRETAKKAFEFLKAKWEAASKNARIITISVTAAVIISIITVIALSSRTDYAVLYRGVESYEMTDIASALQQINVPVRISGDTISVPRDKEDMARMELAVMGFPKSTLNYDLWNNGVGMFSTDTQTQEIMRQQLEDNLRGTLRQLTPVRDATVRINLSEREPYVINPERSAATVGISLTLNTKLSDKQIQGIYSLVISSVPSLKPENVSIIDNDGNILVADDTSSQEIQHMVERQKMNYQREYKKGLENDLETQVRKLFGGVFKNFTVAVTADVDYSDWIEEVTEYTGSNVDENGHQTGVVDHDIWKTAWNGVIPDGGVPGAPVDADISPDYPTWIGEEGGEGFYENMRETDFLVNERKWQSASNGFLIKSVSASVMIDETNMTGERLDDLSRAVAMSINTDVEKVSVLNVPFTFATPDQPIVVPGPSPVRNLLVFIIIALGVLLIMLFVLAIMSSGSKKRRLIRARAAAFQGASATPSFGDDFGAFPSRHHEEEEDEKIEIQSLLGAGDGETREALLKNEIREFAKTNPDIVAQLIRTWIREE